MADQQKIADALKATWAAMVNASPDTIRELQKQMEIFLEKMLEQREASDKMHLMMQREK